MLQGMRDANIVTLYKTKGDRSDCNNYRGISLLRIVGKLFDRIALNRPKYVQKESTQNEGAGFEPTDPQSTWCSLSGNY